MKKYAVIRPADQCEIVIEYQKKNIAEAAFQKGKAIPFPCYEEPVKKDKRLRPRRPQFGCAKQT